MQASRSVHDVAGDHALAGTRTCVDVHERLAGVDGDADLELAVLDDAIANRERRPHGTLGVVFVRDRRAEDRHHRVADELLHGAAALFELGAEPLVVRPKDRLHVLGVERLGARREADQVGEQGGNDLTLAASAHMPTLCLSCS